MEQRNEKEKIHKIKGITKYGFIKNADGNYTGLTKL